MSAHANPDIVDDGLVFLYDTDDGKSYKGEPTTNLFPSPQLDNNTNTTVGEASITLKNFDSDLVGLEMIQAATSNIVSFSMGSLSSAVSGGTYTWSSYVNSTSVGHKVKAQVTVRVDGVRYWLTNSNTWTTSTTECTHLFAPTIANEWHRVDTQFTMPTGTLTDFQLGGWYRSTSNFTLRVANAQLELKSHATPFVDGTRSSTQGLLDRTGNSTIDISDASFDSNAQMTFDGTDDYIPLTGNILNVDAFTVEAVVNITSTGNYNKPIFVAGNLSNSGIWFFKHRSGLGNRLVMHGYDGVNPRIDVVSVNQVPDAQNTYVAVTFDGSAYQLYMNGELEGSPVVDNKVGATTTNYIGKQSSIYLDGDIPTMKIYNKALTPDEILQNFNATKSRFGL
jgi:hypothetical protein